MADAVGGWNADAKGVTVKGDYSSYEGTPQSQSSFPPKQREGKSRHQTIQSVLGFMFGFALSFLPEDEPGTNKLGERLEVT